MAHTPERADAAHGCHGSTPPAVAVDMTEPEQTPPDPTPPAPSTGSAPTEDGPASEPEVLLEGRSRWRRALLLAAGCISLSLAALGIVLPLLPTTPLVLLAGFFFARGSRRAHRWLLGHRLFGPIVREWEEHRTIPRRAKWTAIILIVVAFMVSFLVVPNCVYGYVTLTAIAVALIIFLATLPSRPSAA